MKRILLTASAAATLVVAGTAHAQDYSAIARALYSEGYQNQAKIRVRGNELHVETSGTAGRTERVYSLDGVLLEEESRDENGWTTEREYDLAGNLLEEEREYDPEDDDDHDDDDEDDDEDDNDDDDEDDGDDDDEDDDDDDGDDDEEDDDDEDEDEDED